MNHLMIDIETLGRKDDAIITQIGAMFFSPTGMPGEYGECFKSNVDIASQKGRTCTTDTIQFWLEQPKEASAHIVDKNEENFPLDSVLGEFKNFIILEQSGRRREKEKLFFWANGVTFDFPKLENAFEFCDMETPWAYHQLCDLRTLRNLVHPKRCQETYTSRFARGEDAAKHDALDDCRTQVAMLQELLVDIKG